MATVATVAVLVSTRNRASVSPWTQAMIAHQTYPKERIKVIVVDGSQATNKEAWPDAVCYAHFPDIPLGASRNMCIELALSLSPPPDYMALWDDDDFYSPEHLESHIKGLESAIKIEISGCSMNGLYYLENKSFLLSGPYGPRHSIEPCCVFKRSYARTHRFLYHTRGLMSEFTNDFSEPMLQVYDTVVVIAHTSNTYDKKQILDDPERWNCTASNIDKLFVFQELVEYLQSHPHPFARS